MMSRDGQGLTPVLLETRCSHSANHATWTTGGPADSEEPGTGVAGDKHDGPRHREVVPEFGLPAPDAGTRLAPQRGPGAATKLDQPHRDREGMCAITMPCVYSPMVATLTPCHKLGCKIVHSVQDFQN